MTKQEVRAVALAKLRLTATDTVWDVGAGTGSVSIEAALVARAGSVWAVERNAAGVRLIRENADAFGCGNVHAVPGVAPEALAKLPVPDAVFVGGSAGEWKEIYLSYAVRYFDRVISGYEGIAQKEERGIA